MFVTNGGYGGVQYALRYGVPIVATGGKEDKPEVGGRVVWSGVGRQLKTEAPTPAAVRDAIHAVLRDPSFAGKARGIASSMAGAGGLASLAELVHKSAATTS